MLAFDVFFGAVSVFLLAGLALIIYHSRKKVNSAGSVIEPPFKPVDVDSLLQRDAAWRGYSACISRRQ